MKYLVNHPYFVAVTTFIILWVSTQIGARVLVRFQNIAPEERDNFALILGATLTLLGLIVGFTFSMAIGRYDQRKNLEEEEANAIGTEYVRAELLPGDSTEKLHGLLNKYLDQRILFYQSRDLNEIRKIDADTARLQNELWATARQAGQLQPTPVSALAVSGMNDVLNSQGYTQAAWLNRIPIPAWTLMFAIAICCNVLLGFSTSRTQVKIQNRFLVVLPLVFAISFQLMVDIDSPRKGLIRVVPQNLISLSQSLHATN